ncbi:peptide chain release factor N(5)-glutamine methyltransferase [Nigerium massiliense]|uniref:peptide chain release factor N(5)-glutamine methyltransferase n=1 Tax=Nigerium massiliense TaxID=1522317 RepID=UPI00058DE632|nr:peptide chain release factor N(5)-glutamine methyltransferase [Nigerium massiliense]
MPVARDLLHRAGADLNSGAEARTLLAHVLGTDLHGLLLADDVSGAEADAFAALVRRRLDGVPVQHLTGEAYFRTVRVEVGPGVFIPRPETEVMTGFALDRLAEVRAEGRPPVAVELCAGSGAISLAIATEAPDVELHCVELSEDAADYLRRNLAGTDVDIVVGDMAAAFTHLDGSVDVVVANPPYIPLDSYGEVPADVRDHDPALALFSGPDGLDAMAVVARVAARLLRPGGWVCAEHADVQGESAPAVFLATDAYDRVTDHVDLNHRPRFTAARRSAGKMEP